MGVGYRAVGLSSPAVAEFVQPPPAVSYGNVFDALCASYEADEAERVSELRTRDHLYYADNPLHAARRAQRRRISGRERHAQLNATLDNFGWVRWASQLVFHREMTKTIIPHLYRDDLDGALDGLLRDFDCEEFYTQLMIISDRRKGKSISVAMFAAACMLVLEATHEPFVQAVFSTGRRASQKLLDATYRMLIRIPGAAASIETHNMEALSLRGPHGPTDVRQFFSYPSKVMRAHARARAQSPAAGRTGRPLLFLHGPSTGTVVTLWRGATPRRWKIEK
jgi:hypothetical protein